MLYAVVLVGVPGRIINGVFDVLRNRFSDNHVFRGAGATLSPDGLTRYNNELVQDAIRMAGDAVFGKSTRPNGFCRNTARPCALRNASKASCGKTENQSCQMQRPDFLVVLYQGGIDESKLEEALHFSAYISRLSNDCYNHQTRTANEVIRLIIRAREVLGILRGSINSNKSPILLPPDNYRSSHLKRLMKDAIRDGAKSGINQFRRENFNKAIGGYQGRAGLGFVPASIEARHGVADIKDRTDIALSRVYRLGVTYTRDLHYDVSRMNGKDLGGQVQFICREQGARFPVDRHVNLTVDDCVLG